MRDAVLTAFGPELVEELDRLELEVVKRKLRLLPRQPTST